MRAASSRCRDASTEARRASVEVASRGDVAWRVPGPATARAWMLWRATGSTQASPERGTGTNWAGLPAPQVQEEWQGGEESDAMCASYMLSTMRE